MNKQIWINRGNLISILKSCKMEHNFFPVQSVFATCAEMENHFLGQSNVFVQWGKTIFRSKLKIALYLSEITSEEKSSV